MSPSSPAPPTPSSIEDPIAYWNQVAAPGWIAAQPLLDRHLAPLGELALDRAAPRPGERGLDVGCGCGATTLELARRVGPKGRALGVDVSRPMLARARERAAAHGLAHARFVEADLERGPAPEAPHDLAISRFGVMFFREPARAFANLAASLRPGGRLAFVVWQARERNPWFTAALPAIAQHLPLPPPPPPGAPGPFALADRDRLHGLLADAGLHRIEIEPFETRLAVAGGDLEDAVTLYTTVGPAAAALREHGVDDATRTAVTGALREALAAHVEDGAVRLGAAVWVALAERPA